MRTVHASKQPGGRVLAFPTTRIAEPRPAPDATLERGVYTAPYLAAGLVIANAIDGSGARVAECVVRGDEAQVIALLEQLLDVVDPVP